MWAPKDYRKNQMVYGFLVAWLGSWFTVWLMVRPLAWLIHVRGVALFDGIQISAELAIWTVAVVCCLRLLITRLRRPTDEQRAYPAVSADQVLDLYFRFMATAAVTAITMVFGLLGLRDLGWASPDNAIVMVFLGCIPGWIAWLVIGRWLRPYPTA